MKRDSTSMDSAKLVRTLNGVKDFGVVELVVLKPIVDSAYFTVKLGTYR